MNKDNAKGFGTSGLINDSLTELLRLGARGLIEKAVATELQFFLSQYENVTDLKGRKTVVRNGYLPEREVLTGLGPIDVRVPKVRDRSGSGVKFNSAIVPPYVRKAKRVEAALPWLYLRGISTGNMQEALSVLLGDEAKGLSPAVVSRLKAQWSEDYLAWTRRDLTDESYVYIWADGIYSTLRGEDDRLCLLVIVGVNEQGEKRLLALSDGYRESKASWLTLIQDLASRGLKLPPKLAIGDGALGFWAALDEAWPQTRCQRCWVHKTANVLKAFDQFVRNFSAKYPKATGVLVKDRAVLLSFYDFPAEHWAHIRTTNPIESTFATIRHRTTRTKNCVSRNTLLGLVFQLALAAERSWLKLRGFNRLTDVLRGIKFEDGIAVIVEANDNVYEQQNIAT
jgi:putative transposase